MIKFYDIKSRMMINTQKYMKQSNIIYAIMTL